MFENGLVKQRTSRELQIVSETYKKTTRRTGRMFQYNAPRIALIVDSAMCKGVSQIVRLLVQTD